MSLAENMASASPPRHSIKANNARKLKNPPSLRLLRTASRSEWGATLERVKDGFFILLGLELQQLHSLGVETLQSACVDCQTRHDALFQKPSKHRTLPLVIGSPCISQAF